MTQEFLYQLLTALVIAGATYGGIRADIKHMHEKIEDIKAISVRAHRRIDDYLTKERKENEHI